MPCPVKSGDFGAAFSPLRASWFGVTRNISGYGKHSLLLCPEHEMFFGHEELSGIGQFRSMHRSARKGAAV